MIQHFVSQTKVLFSHRITCLSKKDNQSEMNNDLKWSKHVTSVSAKASKVLGIVKRNLWNCSKSVKTTAYTAIVRPKLEYACVAWDPYLQKTLLSLRGSREKQLSSVPTTAILQPVLLKCFMTLGNYDPTNPSIQNESWAN